MRVVVRDKREKSVARPVTALGGQVLRERRLFGIYR
jgi:hypothetical protein